MGWDDGHDKLVAEVAELRAQVADLQSVVDSNAEVQEQIAEIVNSSNVYHTDFFARSLAIWGHALVWGIAASFIVGLFTALLGWGM